MTGCLFIPGSAYIFTRIFPMFAGIVWQHDGCSCRDGLYPSVSETRGGFFALLALTLYALQRQADNPPSRYWRAKLK